MVRMNKLLVGGVGLLLCFAVFARLSSVNTEVQSPELDSLASLYLSAAPYSLVTPVGFHVRTVASTFQTKSMTMFPGRHRRRRVPTGSRIRPFAPTRVERLR